MSATDDLLERIRGSERRKLTMKLRSLAEFLGRGRLQRLRESTLSEMLQTLNDAGIAYAFPRGRGAADYITMSLHLDPTRLASLSSPPVRPSGERAQSRMLALSVRQPYVELILRGEKKEEYRSRPSKVRGRVYLYASNSPADDADSWDKVGCAPGDLPTGKLVGTVEVVGCNSYGEHSYGWALRNPERLDKPIAPSNHPQPAWFYPWPEGAERCP